MPTRRDVPPSNGLPLHPTHLPEARQSTYTSSYRSGSHLKDCRSRGLDKRQAVLQLLLVEALLCCQGQQLLDGAIFRIQVHRRSRVNIDRILPLYKLHSQHIHGLLAHPLQFFCQQLEHLQQDTLAQRRCLVYLSPRGNLDCTAVMRVVAPVRNIYC